MTPRLLHTYLSIIAALLFVILLWPPPANAEEQARGMGSYLLGPGMPTIFTFDRHSMSCAAQDSFSMTLKGWGLLFDEHLFRPAGAAAGLVSGDIVIRPGYFCSTAVVSFMKFSLGNG